MIILCNVGSYSVKFGVLYALYSFIIETWTKADRNIVQQYMEDNGNANISQPILKKVLDVNPGLMSKLNRLYAHRFTERERINLMWNNFRNYFKAQLRHSLRDGNT